MNVRALAAYVIADVLSGQSLSDCLPERLQQCKDPRDQALLQAICFGVCRFYFRLDFFLGKLLKHPLKKKDNDIRALLLIGLYQLAEMRIPDYAAVSDTVDAVKILKKIWAKNLVNAVLREYLRRAQELAETQKTYLPAEYLHPIWLIEKIKKIYPDEWMNILNENNQHPPFTLRVNLARTTRETYLKKLAAENISAYIIPEIKSGIVLETPHPVEALPGFAEGDVSVQDAGAQFAAELLEVKRGFNVLDACAAPGGKTTHILEVAQHINLLAIDQDRKRLARVQENLQRLKFSAKCITADAANIASWWDGKEFDRILLDAPCSASGVIRRHPDIKLLRQPKDIEGLAKEQLRLLTALWPLLRKGGMLVYVTCSIFPEENNEVIQKFLSLHENAKEEKINGLWGQACDVGRQILPGMHLMDGFYYACLRHY